MHLTVLESICSRPSFRGCLFTWLHLRHPHRKCSSWPLAMTPRQLSANYTEGSLLIRKDLSSVLTKGTGNQDVLSWSFWVLNQHLDDLKSSLSRCEDEMISINTQGLLSFHCRWNQLVITVTRPALWTRDQRDETQPASGPPQPIRRLNVHNPFAG